MLHRLTVRLVSFGLALGWIVSGVTAGCASSDTSSAGCTKDSDCKGERICSLEGQCVEPSTTASTTSGTVGSGGATASSASGAGGDGAGSASSGAASSTATASTGSGMMCGPGLTACFAMCVNTKTDPKHCGACGNACASNGSCVNSKCTDPACAAHTPCSAGAKLPANCNTCTTKVCEQDDYCCTAEWDTMCVSIAKTVLACGCK